MKRKLNKKKIVNLKRWAKDLNKKVPKSEQWFRSLYKSYFFKSKHDYANDEYNSVMSSYIVDLINKKFKYAVEVDGSFHDRADQKVRDERKTIALEKRGYRVIRIKAYDENSFKAGLENILELRSNT